jgi:hypothetical protein
MSAFHMGDDVVGRLHLKMLIAGIQTLSKAAIALNTEGRLGRRNRAKSPRHCVPMIGLSMMRWKLMNQSTYATSELGDEGIGLQSHMANVVGGH